MAKMVNMLHNTFNAVFIFSSLYNPHMHSIAFSYFSLFFHKTFDIT